MSESEEYVPHIRNIRQHRGDGDGDAERDWSVRINYDMMTRVILVDVAVPDLKETGDIEMIGPKLLISLQYRDEEQSLELILHRASNLSCGE